MLHSAASVNPQSHCRDQLFANVHRTVRFEVFQRGKIHILFICVMAPHNLLDGTNVSGKHAASFFCPTMWCRLQSRDFITPLPLPDLTLLQHRILTTISVLSCRSDQRFSTGRHHGRYVMHRLTKTQVCKKATTLLRTSY
jgi:hypothetical protein